MYAPRVQVTAVRPLSIDAIKARIGVALFGDGFAVVVRPGGSRGQARNAAIMAAHAHGTRHLPRRDPFFLTPEQRVTIRNLVRAAIRPDRGPTREALREVGKALVAAFRENVDAGRGRDGPLAALDPKYAKRKQKKFGGGPILVATGDLMGGLVADVVQL